MDIVSGVDDRSLRTAGLYYSRRINHRANARTRAPKGLSPSTEVDGRLARFISSDSIVPNPGSSMSWDRFAYVNGNPLSFIDPTGHDIDCAIGRSCEQSIADAITWKFRNIHIKNAAEFRKSELDNLYGALNKVFSAFGNSRSAFYAAFGEINYTHMPSGTLKQGAPANAEIWGRGVANINLTPEASYSNIIHEMGHAFDSVYRRQGGRYLISQLFVWEFNKGTCHISPCYNNETIVHGRTGSILQKNTAWIPSGNPTSYGLTSSLEDFADSFLAVVVGSTAVDSNRVNLINILNSLYVGS